MDSSTLSPRELRLRLQAARAVERSLPDLVRRAFGQAPPHVGDLPADEPLVVGTRERAQGSLVERGFLTHVELSTLPVEDAIRVAVDRLQAQIAALEAEQANRPRPAKAFGKAPRTLRR